MKQPHRLTIACPAAERDAANQLFVDLFAGDEAQRDTLSVPLNAQGDEAAPTHYACSIQLSAEQAAWLKREARARKLKMRWRLTDALSGELMETTSGAVKPDAQGRRREVDALDALGEMGVKVRRERLNDAQVLEAAPAAVAGDPGRPGPGRSAG